MDRDDGECQRMYQTPIWHPDLERRQERATCSLPALLVRLALQGTLRQKEEEDGRWSQEALIKEYEGCCVAYSHDPTHSQRSIHGPPRGINHRPMNTAKAHQALSALGIPIVWQVRSLTALHQHITDGTDRAGRQRRSRVLHMLRVRSVAPRV